MRPWGEGDRARLLDLIRAADLPDAELGGHDPTYGLGLYVGEALVGGCAVEGYQQFGLLRSVVVAEEHRGLGGGSALVAEAVARAAAAGLGGLYLLTESAASFFEAQGFHRIERVDVPAPVQASAEFSYACPEGAVAMMISSATPQTR